MTNSNFLKRALLCCAIMLIAALSGCAVAPDVRHVDKVSLNLVAGSDFDLDIVNAADPDARPGAMAGGMALQGLKDCSDGSQPAVTMIFAPFCAAIAAATGATAGAVITRTTTLPDDAARDLNIASLKATTGTNWPALFHGHLRTAAATHGKNVVPTGYGVPVYIDVHDLAWDVSAGDRVAMRATIEVAIKSGKNMFNRQVFKVRSKRMGVAKWLDAGGAPISAELRRLLDESSKTVWQNIAG